MESYDASEKISVEDYSDTLYYSTLKELPTQLAIKHLRYIENENMSDAEALDYLADILSQRTEALHISEISDKELARDISGHESSMFDQLENWTRTNPDNYLGTGTTAMVKSYDITAGEKDYSLAVKYVVSPNKMTLTAQAEHDVVSEVERLKAVELAETKYPARSKFIRVPHPYLHLRSSEVQLFGMEKVDGITLQQARDGFLHEDFKNKLMETPLATMPIAEVEGYIERFFDTMHEYCLHGDIKPRNIMINSNGVFYIIDFGQSRLAHTVPEAAQEQYDNLKSDEITLAKSLIKQFITQLRQQHT